ncbi:LLM class flavin-dependent oxidoreductase [Bradyrhizobium commune]|uniref:LLM class flavin-dependent oxidoreductase n=2 Tax=Bradyrhizobium commune TaxID=83627 RepID=A0A7S9D443_9BRAD|nr:LLM class flavin-dependent oxidoreductase [Bradyrhizobium commune]
MAMNDQTNPIFGQNRLKLGIFGLNGRGSAQTLVPEAYRPSWANALEASKMADGAGYEAIVAYARYKGFVPGNTKHPTGVVFDPFTLSAAIGQATRYSAIFPTTHAPTMHPIVAAKQCATIDAITGGRLALNIVAGWNKPELEMFGAPLKEHTERYQHLAEWLAILKRLWTEEDEFDFKGKFYNIEKGMSMPKPVQKPYPPIMNAGGSEIGRRFACEQADICFVLFNAERPEAWQQQISDYKRYALEEFGRKVQVWAFAPVVQRDTQAEAERYVEYYAVENADTESVDRFVAQQEVSSKGASPEVMHSLRRNFAAGGGGALIVGSADSIVDRLHSLSDAGLDGLLMTFVNFKDGIARFNRDVLPILETRGLRAQFKPQHSNAAG